MVERRVLLLLLLLCRLHGTRDAVTAALHIALGDCTALDVGRMVTLPPADTQQQPAAAGNTQDSCTGAAVQTYSAGKQQQDIAPAAAWEGLSAGSHSELLLGGRGLPTSSSNGAAVTQHSSSVSADGVDSAGGGSATQGSRAQRRQQQKAQQKQRQKQAEQQQDVTLHIPQLRHFVCVANYGFLGDVMESSEKLRFCGPMRCALDSSSTVGWAGGILCRNCFWLANVAAVWQTCVLSSMTQFCHLLKSVSIGLRWVL
jgi:hypothetical protein